MQGCRFSAVALAGGAQSRPASQPPKFRQFAAEVNRYRLDLLLADLRHSMSTRGTPKLNDAIRPDRLDDDSQAGPQHRNYRGPRGVAGDRLPAEWMEPIEPQQGTQDRLIRLEPAAHGVPLSENLRMSPLLSSIAVEDAASRPC